MIYQGSPPRPKTKLTDDMQGYIQELVVGTDWSARQIAKACGVSHQSVYSLYRGGLEKWRRVYRDEMAA